MSNPARLFRDFVPLVLAVICSLFDGCHTSPFGPRFVAEPFAEPAPPPTQVEFRDARPAWQRRYWQGAVTPRDYELAITVIPLEKFAPADEPSTGAGSRPVRGAPPLFRTPDQRGLAHVQSQFLQGLEKGRTELGLASAPARLTIDSCVVVVNKIRALEGVWEQTAEARRETLAHWRRGLPLRMTLGVSSGFGPGAMGAGAQFGPPQDLPPLPGEHPLSRAYGPVRGPPPELGEYGPDVTCDIRARVELTLADGESREVSLRVITRSLPLEPPHFLADEAVSATFAAALRRFPDELVAAWQADPRLPDTPENPTSAAPVSRIDQTQPWDALSQDEVPAGSSGGNITFAGSTTGEASPSGVAPASFSGSASPDGAGGTKGFSSSP